MSYPTWSDLNSPSLVPPLGSRQAPSIGPVALMVSTEPDLRYIAGNFGKFDTQSFFTGTLMTRNRAAVAGPFIGAPYAVMLLESLIAKGARSILVLGWCGALTQDLAPGDLIVPSRAICDEGTSRHYTRLDPDLPVSQPDPALSQALTGILEHRGQKVRSAPIWTTDAIYRETAEKVAWHRDRGAVAVEMECSALFAAAAFRSVAMAALLVVSDSLAGADWDPGFKKTQFKTNRRAACQAILELTESFAHDL